jgi:hypothetical protein
MHQPIRTIAVRADLILCQEKAAELKNCANPNCTNITQNSHAKNVISWGLGD